jgi:hypothetical protein
MMTKGSNKTTIKIEFANEKAAEMFALWLCNGGEQHYWEQQRGVNDYYEEDVTAVEFHYHGEEDKEKARDDPSRYGSFMSDWTIRTTLGRLSLG